MLFMRDQDFTSPISEREERAREFCNRKNVRKRERERERERERKKE